MAVPELQRAAPIECVDAHFLSCRYGIVKIARDVQLTRLGHEMFASICAFTKWLSNLLAHYSIRIILWGIAVIGSLFPPFYAADARISLDFIGMVAKVNKAGFFRDVFYVAIVIALIGISNILSDVFTSSKKPHLWAGAVYLLAIAYFLAVVIYGTGAFSRMANAGEAAHVIAPDDFNYDLGVIFWTVVVGLLTEMVLAWRETGSK